MKHPFTVALWELLRSGQNIKRKHCIIGCTIQMTLLKTFLEYVLDD